MSHYFEPPTALATVRWYDPKDYGAKGDGVTNDDAAVARAIAALPVATPGRGGVVHFSRGDYLLTTSLGFDGGRQFLGDGPQSTRILWQGAGYCFDYNASTGNADFSVQGMTIEASTAAMTGAIRVGRTSDAYSNNSFRNRVRLRDLVLLGPGAATAGKFGMSLTQLADSRIDNVYVSGFESGILFDRTTQTHGSGITIGAFAFGIEWRRGDAPGGAQDHLIGLDLNGPAVSGGWNLKFDQTFIEVDQAHLEATPGNGITNKCFVWFTANSGGDILADSLLIWGPSGTGAMTNSVLIDAAAGRGIELIGVRSGAGAAALAAMSIGAPGGRVSFVGCDNLVTDVIPAGAFTSNYVQVIGSNSSSQAFISGTLAIGAALRRSTQSPAFAANVTPNAIAGEQVYVGALTANITIAAPTNSATGQSLTFYFTQDGVGGWTVTWNAAFLTTWVDTGNTLNKRASVTFTYDGTNWRQVGAQQAWA